LSLEEFLRHPDLRLFLFSLAGSIAVECLKIVLNYEAGKPLPSRYYRKGFWVSRIMLALMAGVFALSWRIEHYGVAFYTGVSFPMILQGAMRNPPDLPPPTGADEN